MSRKHPIIAVTGSSGAGTSTVMQSFQHIFRREGIKAQVVEGDSFHRYNRYEMRTHMVEQVVRYLRRIVPEMRGLGFYNGVDFPEGSTPEKVEMFERFGDEMCLKYFIKPVITLMKNSLWVEQDADGKALSDVGLLESTDADGDLTWSVLARPAVGHARVEQGRGDARRRRHGRVVVPGRCRPSPCLGFTSSARWST